MARRTPDLQPDDERTADPQSTIRSRPSFLAGIALLVLAAVLWSLNGALIKLVYDEGRGPHGVTIAFYRSLFAGLFLLPLARGRFHTLRHFGRRETRWPIRPAAISCIVFFTLMTVCFVVANTKTEAANAIILQYTSTFWVFALSPWLLKERAGRGDLWILSLAMAGIAVIFAGRAATNLAGLVIALAAGLFYGLETMMIRRLRDCDSAALIVVCQLGSVLLLLPAALLVGTAVASHSTWVLLIQNSARPSEKLTTLLTMVVSL